MGGASRVLCLPRSVWKERPAVTSTIPHLLLGREQAERLLRYMQDYRQFALSSTPPTHERNTMLRLVQALQGKLLALLDHEQPRIWLVLDTEDVSALQIMTKSL